MYQCRFCGFESASIKDFEEDFTNHKGYWCPCCDGFTYYETEERSFLLYLEDKGKEEEYKKVPFPVHCSPLRYPGGKSRLIGTVLGACREDYIESFIEPFAGGASVGLSLLLAGRIKELYLNDADFGVYSLFCMIQEHPEVLKELISTFIPSKEAYNRCKEIVLSSYKDCTKEEAAWSLLVTNRLAFSGIPFANCMSKPEARWNAKTLCNRIDKIHRVAEHIHVSNLDAYSFIEEMYWKPRATLFIDPPYYEKGNKLYPCSYTEEDHKKLSFLLDELYKGVPGADMLVTYDLQKEISEMYAWPEKVVIGRKYSIAN